jgi:transposase
MKSLSFSKKRFSAIPTPQASQGEQREPQRAEGVDIAAALGTPGSPSETLPANPEVVAKATRRRFPVEYKLKFLEQADRCQDTGQLGALLRREGLYHSNLQLWRRQREQGILSGLTPRKRGRKANPQSQLVEEIQQLERQNQRLSKRLQQAQKLPPILIIQENIQPVITWAVRWYQLPAGSIRSGRAIRGKILQALCIMTRPDPIFPRNTNAQI